MRRKTSRFFIFMLLCVLSCLMLFPLLWMIRSSFMSSLEILSMPVKWIPSEFRLENFKEVLSEGDFWTSFRNSLVIVIFSVTGQVLSSSFAAFGFSRLNFRGKKFWFALLMATMMIPSTVLMVPQFIGWQSVGAYNTFLPLILPCFFGNAFYIFMVRQFYNAIPREYDAAALVDGAGYLTVYWKIILPMSRPVLCTVAVFAFLNAWNDFMGPLLYLEKPELKTVSLALQSYMGQHVNQWNLLMTFALLAILPVILLFFFAQKFFLDGGNYSGLKM